MHRGKHVIDSADIQKAFLLSREGSLGQILGGSRGSDRHSSIWSKLCVVLADSLGQYLRPSAQHIPVARWVTPEEFEGWKRVGEDDLGFRHVEAGPLVRSSYHAKEQAREVEAGAPGRIQDVLEADISAPAEVLTSRLVQIENRL